MQVGLQAQIPREVELCEQSGRMNREAPALSLTLGELELRLPQSETLRQVLLQGQEFKPKKRESVALLPHVTCNCKAR